MQFFLSSPWTVDLINSLISEQIKVYTYSPVCTIDINTFEYIIRHAIQQGLIE